MPEITTEKLAEFFREAESAAFRIKGFVETADSRYLGAIGLSFKHPMFSSIHGFNFNGMLSDDAKFWTQPLRPDVEGKEGLAAIFRQFESSKYQATPEDLMCGWVPPEDALKLEGWVAEMNRQLKGLLEIKHRAK